MCVLNALICFKKIQLIPKDVYENINFNSQISSNGAI